MINNHEFANAVGCDHTTASRLRSGQRRPSAKMLLRICSAYNLDEGIALRNLGEGAEQFSTWLRQEVFDKPDEQEAA